MLFSGFIIKQRLAVAQSNIWPCRYQIMESAWLLKYSIDHMFKFIYRWQLYLLQYHIKIIIIICCFISLLNLINSTHHISEVIPTLFRLPTFIIYIMPFESNQQLWPSAPTGSQLLIILFIISSYVSQVDSACTDGMGNCRICYDINYCIVCQSGYRLTTDLYICQPCNSGIKTCLISPNYFESLLPGYTFANSIVERCQDTHCSTCATSTGICDTCLPGYQIENFICVPCDPQCQRCMIDADPSYCTSCYDGYYNDGNGRCFPISVPNCRDSLTASTCDNCLPKYGLIGATLCRECASIACVDCNGDHRICNYCQKLYGVVIYNSSSHGCQRCTDLKCVDCSSDANVCVKCQLIPNVGVNSGQCLNCSTTECNICTSNSLLCTQCKAGYGLDFPVISGSSNQCILCNQSLSYCLTCNPKNLYYCYTCPIGRFIYTNNICQNCLPNCNNCTNLTQCICCTNYYGLSLDKTACTLCNTSTSFCDGCNPTNIQICTSCPDYRFLASNDSKCYECPQYCVNCIESAGIVQCTRCQNYTSLDAGTKLCKEICGDLVTFGIEQCDNQLYQTYDGCTDTCLIQDDFECLQANVSLCSYNGTIIINYIDIKNKKGQINQFALILQVLPPLAVFKTTPEQELKSIFSFYYSDIQLPIISVKYNVQTNTFQFVGQIKQNMLSGGQLKIQFTPTNSSMLQYSKSQQKQQIVVLPKNIYYVSANQQKLSQIILYVCYGISVLSWISLVLGVVLRRLPGLQAMFVVQISYVAFLCVNSYLLVIFGQTYPLKYSTGYNHAFVKQQHSIQISQSPYFEQFVVSKHLLSNNFNISLILEIIPIIMIIVTHQRLKNQINNEKQKQLAKQNHQNKQVNKKPTKLVNPAKYKTSEIIKKEVTKMIEQNQLAYQLLLVGCLVSLVYFTACSALFFKYGTYNDGPSLAIFALQMIITIVILVKFYLDPVVFDYFRFSFDDSQLAMRHQLIHIFVYELTVMLLVLLAECVWACLIPIAILLAYTLIYRPYKQLVQNLRSALNQVTVLSILFFRVYLEYICDEQELNSTKTLIFLSINVLFLLPLVLIISIVSSAYMYYYYQYKYPKQLKQAKTAKQTQIQKSRNKLLYQLIQINPNERLENIPIQTVYKQIISGKNTLLNSANDAQLLQQQLYLSQNTNREDRDKCVTSKSLTPLKLLNNSQFQQTNGEQYKMCRQIMRQQKLQFQQSGSKHRASPNEQINSRREHTPNFRQNNNLHSNDKQKRNFSIDRNNKLTKKINQSEHEAQLAQMNGTSRNQRKYIIKQPQAKQQSPEKIIKDIAATIVMCQNTFINLQAAVNKTLQILDQDVDEDGLLEYSKIDAHFTKN